MVPELSFTIPSIHDNTLLDCRVYHPTKSSATSSSFEKSCNNRGAIVAHPYTTLGGSYDDYIVVSTVSELLKLGFVVGTFNFRGAGSSQGKASWTAKAELSDYVSFIGFFMQYINALRSPIGLESSQNLSEDVTTSSRTSSSNDALTGRGMTLLLGGYSYGSLITSHLPTMEQVLNRFAKTSRGTAEDEIRLRALSLSMQWNKEADLQSEVRGRGLRSKEKLGESSHSIAIVMGGEATEPGTNRSSRDSKRSFDIIRKSVDRSRRRLALRKPSSGHESEPHLSEENVSTTEIPLPRVQYLLISPLLPPISSLATMFSKLDSHFPSFSQPHESTGGLHTSSHSEHMLTSHPTLAVYGGNDFFTSHKKLRKWAENLVGKPGSNFQFREIAGAGHFWQEEGVEKLMRCSIREWLQEFIS